MPFHPPRKKTILDHPRQDRLPGEVAPQVFDLQVAHRLARLHGGAADVGKEHRVVQGEELRRHARLVGVDVEPGTGDLPLLQVAQQDRLVHDRTAGDIYEIALRAERIQYLRVDDAIGLGARWRHHHEDVAVLRQRDRVRIVGIGHVLLVPVVVADLHAAGRYALGDRLAYTPQTQDAEGLAAERGGER